MSQSESTVNRRRVLRNLGLVGAGAALSSCIQPPVVAQAPSDLDVLNFALNLEYLEAEFYLAAVGRTPTYATSGSGVEGAVTFTNGRRAVPFTTDASRQAAEEVATDEENHVKFLRTVIASLGGTPVARPALDLGPAFQAAGNVASAGAITNFDPYASELLFLHGSFIFEDVGVTAYKGGSRFLTNKDVIENAAGILAVEAYHSGAVRTALYALREAQVTPTLKVRDVVQAISNLRDGADGPTDLDQGVTGGETLNPGAPAEKANSANIVPTDANGLAFSRTVSQVLRVVYLGNNQRGGFFPAGLNHARTDFKTVNTGQLG